LWSHMPNNAPPKMHPALMRPMTKELIPRTS
jgi:hypothetical protein